MEKILNELIDSYEKEMIADLQSLVNIPSIQNDDTVRDNAPFGENVRKALDKVLFIAKKLGFETKDYNGYAASIKLGNHENEVGVLCHADVVPVDDNWATDPFQASIVDGKMYGRGTIDDKGPLIAVLYAMKAIKESGLPIESCINHIVGCNEETGHECIKYYLKKEKCPNIGFSPDGCFPVIHGEKGIIRYEIKSSVVQSEEGVLKIERIVGGTVVNTVPDAAKVWLCGEKQILDKVQQMFAEYPLKSKKKFNRIDTCHLLLEFSGVSAHAMQPWLGENAILTMICFLKTLKQISPEMQTFLNSLYEMYGDGWRGGNIGIACEDSLSGPLSQNLGVLIFEGEKVEIKVDVRCPIHADMDIIWKTIKINCQKYHYNPVYWQMRKPLYIPKEDPLVQKLLNVYSEMTGDLATAITIGGGTYCRDVENFVSFGPVFPYETEMAHKANEFIGIKEFVLSAKIYAQALYALAQPK